MALCLRKEPAKAWNRFMGSLNDYTLGSGGGEMVLCLWKEPAKAGEDSTRHILIPQHLLHTNNTYYMGV